MPEDLRGRIIRLAHANPAIRPHLLPLLKEAWSLPVVQLDWDGKEANGWRKWRAWQATNLLRRNGFHEAAVGMGYVVLPPVKGEAAAEAAAKEAVQRWEAESPWSNIGRVSGIIQWAGSGEGTFSGVYSTYRSGS